MVTVALAQLAQESPGPRPTSAAHAVARIADAAEAGADLVVLPELWRTGPFELQTTLGYAEPVMAPDPHATVATMSALAVEHGVWLHAGSVLEYDHDHIYNTSLLFNPDGDLVATYRKHYLFGFDSGEAALLTAGDDVVVVPTPLGPTGLATCYDLRFGEHFRALLDAGAESVLISAGWPSARLAHWDLLLRARAIENQTLMIGCNAAGESGDVPLGGGSLVVNAWGEELGLAGGGDELLLVDVDPAQTAATRAAFPVLRDRRRA